MKFIMTAHPSGHVWEVDKRVALELRKVSWGREGDVGVMGLQETEGRF